MCSLFKNPITCHKDNQGGTTLAVAPHIRPHMKHIVIKYHRFWGSVVNSDVEIQHIDNKDQVVNILVSRYILSCLNIINKTVFARESDITRTKQLP